MNVRQLACLTLVAVLVISIAGCSGAPPNTPEKLSLEGTRLLVWDLSQPKIKGAEDYRSTVLAVAKEFGEREGVEVEVRFVSREDATSALIGAPKMLTEDKGEEGLGANEHPVDDEAEAEVNGGASAPGNQPELPDIVCTGEWPVLGAGARDVSGFISPERYYGPAVEYWRSGETLLAIPAYLHWTASASREGGLGTVYSWDNRGFLEAALGRPAREWEPEDVSAYLEWFVATWGTAGTDALVDWASSSAHNAYPVSPHLWRRLMKDDPGTSLDPIPGSSGFYYTVPGYVVLAEEDQVRDCASRLGVLLAANLGRWAARELGCPPALLDDYSIWTVGSGLSYDTRAAMLSSFSGTVRKAPGVASYLESDELDRAAREASAPFLLGEVPAQDLRRGIQEALRRNTSP